MTARVLVQVICVLAVVCSGEAQVNLAVDYPEPGNYSLVTLTCNDNFGTMLTNNVEFLRRAPGQDSPVQLSGSPTNGEITITLTQEEEGYFSCSSDSVLSTNQIGLAAQPDENYDDTTHRYITFPTGDSSREVNLTCPIRPGALSDSYSVQWESSIPGVPGFTIVDTGNYTITEDIHSTSRHQYQCKVTIEHSNTESETYDGPMIILNKTLLASIENDIQSMSVLEGERAIFTCKFLKGNVSDIAINWSVGNISFNECDSMEDNVAPDGNGCYTNDTHSVLVINTLAPGNYPVQCILEQNIPEDFKIDHSFQETFNNITRSASLTVKPTKPQLDVDYPDVNDYSLVKLTCLRENLPQSDAEFRKDEANLTSGSESHQVAINSTGSGEITFSFTQEQEGYFSCHSRGHSSDEIGLAAIPAVDDMRRHRYITFPTPDSREITLTCPITPGPLSDSQYNVQWIGPTVADRKNYDIKEDIDPSSPPQYQCNVTVQHRSDKDDTTVYNNTITIESLVLATVEGEIENVSISRGESAEFTCKFSKRDVDIDINWSVGDVVFDECGSTEKDIAPDGNGCYTTNTESMLFLGNTSSFSTSNHQVQCVIQQNINDNFKKDPSFEESFNNITSNGILEINPPIGPKDDSPDNGLTVRVGIALGVTLPIGLIVGVILTWFCITWYCNKNKKQDETLVENDGNTGCDCYSWLLCSNRDKVDISRGVDNHEMKENKSEREVTPVPPDDLSPGSDVTPTPVPSDVGLSPDPSNVVLPSDVPLPDVVSPPGPPPFPSAVGHQERRKKEIQEWELVNDLQPLAANWKLLGTLLKISQPTLDAIAAQKDVNAMFVEVLKKWLSGAGGECTKEKLVEVLRSDCCREKKLAAKIEGDNDFPKDLGASHIGLLTTTLSDVAHNYSLFGCMVGISNDDIKKIERMEVDVRNCLKKMVCEWRNEENPMLTHVIEAIRNQPIQNKRLANKLEKKWRKAGYI